MKEKRHCEECGVDRVGHCSECNKYLCMTCWLEWLTKDAKTQEEKGKIIKETLSL